MEKQTKIKFEALKARYNAQKLEAMAVLMTYATNSVGIGEHPQIIEEMDTLIGKIACAEERMTLVESLLEEISGNETLNG